MLKSITAGDFAFNEQTRKLDSYQNYKGLRNVELFWTNVISKTEDSGNKLKQLKSIVDEYYENFDAFSERWNLEVSGTKEEKPFNVDLLKKLKEIQHKPEDWKGTDDQYAVYLISVFSIIAATWPLWDKYGVDAPDHATDKDEFIKNQLHDLSRLLFPQSKENSSDPAAPKANPVDLIADADALFSIGEYSKCWDLLNSIIRNYWSYTSKVSQAKLFTLLDSCHGKVNKLPAGYGSLKQFKNDLTKYGQIFMGKKNPEILPKIQPSESISSGRYCLTCDNPEISRWIRRTSPENWSEFELSDSSLDLLSSSPDNWGQLEDDPDFKKNIESDLSSNLRFIFAEEDEQENIQSALRLMECLRLLTQKYQSDPSSWGQIELVVRCTQELAVPLMDAASSFLDEQGEDELPIFINNPIRIHILDEKKRAADLLYAMHPLFYPLTFEPENNSSFHLMIISDQEDIDHELAVQVALMESDPKMASKPQAVKEKIAAGKIAAYYKENCLLQQEFVKDNTTTVEKYIAAAAKGMGGTLKFVDAVRFEKGEGIEKKQEDFAAEVAAQMNMGK
ncbi:MAG: hypothetical protein HUJ54_12875 [Erysipelotrichaceae bacterium]|nr:hypothetical protein [Erysipelotrichaceae bacterium]